MDAGHTPCLMPTHIELNGGELWDNPERNILLDDEWAREVAREERPPTVRVWRHAPREGLVVSKRDVAGPSGQAAMQVMAASGWPVIVRPTGGTAVPHGQGVLNLSLLFPRRHEKATTDAYYRLLCQPIVDWFATYHLQATTGALPGSYCDGNYNVLVDGKKLVGTAQAWRGGLAGTASRHPGYILAHACIVVDVDLEAATMAINKLYQLVGDTYRVNPSTSSTLSRLLHHHQGLSGYTAETAKSDFLSFLDTYYKAQGVKVTMQNE